MEGDVEAPGRLRAGPPRCRAAGACSRTWAAGGGHGRPTGGGCVSARCGGGWGRGAGAGPLGARWWASEDDGGVAVVGVGRGERGRVRGGLGVSSAEACEAGTAGRVGSTPRPSREHMADRRRKKPLALPGPCDGRRGGAPRRGEVGKPTLRLRFPAMIRSSRRADVHGLRGVDLRCRAGVGKFGLWCLRQIAARFDKLAGDVAARAFSVDWTTVGPQSVARIVPNYSVVSSGASDG
jgi:hypothetical protein